MWFLVVFFCTHYVFISTLSDRYRLDRQLLAAHQAAETRRAAAAVAAETARLAAEWAPLVEEHAALKRTLELRDYQVGGKAGRG